MDDTTILDEIAQAEVQVAVHEEILTRQRQIIEMLGHRGHDATEATELLRTFQEVQAARFADLDRLRADLARAT